MPDLTKPLWGNKKKPWLILSLSFQQVNVNALCYGHAFQHVSA